MAPSPWLQVMPFDGSKGHLNGPTSACDPATALCECGGGVCECQFEREADATQRTIGGHAPCWACRWGRLIGTAVALYGVVLLAVFVGLRAAVIGCLIAAGASEASRGKRTA